MESTDLAQGMLAVRRRKNGAPGTHPLHGPEIRALRRLGRGYLDCRLLYGERKGPPTDSAVRKIVARAGLSACDAQEGEESQRGFPAHPHLLRHVAGFKLADGGQDTRAIQHYLGHKNIMHTIRYTELAAGRFKGFWQD